MSSNRHSPRVLCCNGDGRPIQPPSKVLCKECFAVLDAKMRALLMPRNAPPAKTAAELTDLQGLDPHGK